MKDQLSAWIDGEIAPEEAQHLLTGVKADSELKDAWQHYHLIGDAMRGDAQTHHSLTDRIMLALEDEPTVLAPQVSAGNPNALDQQAATDASANDASNEQTASNVVAIAPRRTWVPTRVWSIAASAAAVMFVGLMLWQNQVAVVDENTPVEIAQEVPLEYLAAHQSVAPNSLSSYIQPAVYEDKP